MKNPFVNAGLALLYIALVVVTIHTFAPGPDTPDSYPLVPIAALSLFVLSAAVMGFLFLYEPIRLYMEGEKKKAMPFFLKTVGFFAVFVIVFFSIIFFAK